jgi:hypothetical protein
MAMANSPAQIEIVREPGMFGMLSRLSIIAFRAGERIGSADYSAGDACGTWYVRACGAKTRYRHDRAKTYDENLSAVELTLRLLISAADADTRMQTEMTRWASAGAFSNLENAQ